MPIVNKLFSQLTGLLVPEKHPRLIYRCQSQSPLPLWATKTGARKGKP